MLLGHLAAAKGLSLRLRLAPQTPFRLRGAPQQLHQVLVNLVGNAIKFTDDGRVVVHVAPVLREGTTVWLRLAVEDTGVGLTPEAQKGLFERFVRSDDSMRRGISGSGLGLNITRELVELMGGSVGLTSTPGQGSTFWVELPLRGGARAGGAGAPGGSGGGDRRPRHRTGPGGARPAPGMRGAVRRHGRVGARACFAMAQGARRSWSRSARHRWRSEHSPGCLP